MMSQRSSKTLRYFHQNAGGFSERAARDIEQYRKSSAQIRLCDAAGYPLPEETLKNLRVEYRLTEHDFRLGANLFMLDEFETEEKNQYFREKFPEVFNLATLPFYWKDLEIEEGNPRYSIHSPRVYRRPAPDLCLAYCEEKGIEPKAHCLNYDYFRPVWLYGADVPTHKMQLIRHFQELSERYAGRIPSWEVTNETFNIPFITENLDTASYSLFYRESDFAEWSFREAMKYFPQNRLVINDHLDFGCMRSLHGEFFNTRSPYYMQIKELIEQGCRVDSIGFQYHCFYDPAIEDSLAVSRFNPEHLYHVLDTYHQLGRRMQITEMTLSAFSEATEDEDFQAELLKDLYTVFFSHPGMEGVVYWNVVDGYAYGTPGKMESGENKFRGGLLHFDMSEKPAYKMLKKLFTQEWYSAGSCDYSASSGFVFRGFKGKYCLTIRSGSHTWEKEIQLKENETFSLILDEDHEK